MTDPKIPTETSEAIDDEALEEAQGGLSLGGSTTMVRVEFGGAEIQPNVGTVSAAEEELMAIKPNVGTASWGGDEEEPMALKMPTKLR